MGRNKIVGAILFCFLLMGALDFFSQNLKPVGHQDFSSYSESSFQKLCALPPQFIDPTIFKKYCGSHQCLRPGFSCSLSKSCCSGMCAEGICRASSDYPALPGETCDVASDCVTNNCGPHPFQRRQVCFGNGREFCSRVADICQDNSNCCSGICSNNRCLGSQQDLARIGSYCYADHSECESHFCNLQTHRCE